MSMRHVECKCTLTFKGGSVVGTGEADEWEECDSSQVPDEAEAAALYDAHRKLKALGKGRAPCSEKFEQTYDSESGEGRSRDRNRR